MSLKAIACPPGSPPANRQPSEIAVPSRWTHAVYLAIAVVTIGLSAILEVPDETQVRVPVIGVRLPELCAFRRYTGYDCPGCGLTRSFIALAHGQPIRAWHFHPAGILWFLAFAFQIPFRSWQIWRLSHGKTEYRHPLLHWFLWALFGALILQWLWRMAA